MANINSLRASLADSPYRSLLDFFSMIADARNLTKSTLLAYWENLARLIEWADEKGIEPSELSRQDILSWIVWYKTRVSATTVNTRLRHFKAFFNVLEVEDMLPGSTNPMAGTKPLKTEQIFKAVIPPEAIAKVVKHLTRKTGFCAYRNRVLVLLLWDSMVRVSELTGATCDSVLWNQSQLKVYGKGRKERVVPMGEKVRRDLFRYYRRYRKRFPGDSLFCTTSGQPLTIPNVRLILCRLSKIARVHLAPHAIRHSAATWYIQQGGSPAILQSILGHSSLLVTQRYVHLSAKDAVKSYEKFSPGNGLVI